MRARTIHNNPSIWKSFFSCVSQRWLFSILASIGLCIQSSFSVIMSITIIEMVVRTESIEEQVNESCPSDNAVTLNKTQSHYQVNNNASINLYRWDEYTQGIILSSFAISSAIVQFFHGSVAERYGGKYILGFGILAQALLTFIIPFVVDWGGSTALIITRVLIGLGSDGMFPVVSTMISRWTVPDDRTFIGNIIYSGTVLGLFFGNILPVLIMKYSGMGWPAVFYVFGVLGIVWFPFWMQLVYENSESHPFISDEELNHLRSTLEAEKSTGKAMPAAPWKLILVCKEFWSFIICFIGTSWAYYLMLSDLPRYLAKVVKFPLESNGYFSSSPYIFMWINTILSAWISNQILKKKLMSVTSVRKLWATISCTGPSIFLLLASYAECDKTTVVAMFMIGITLIGNFYTSTLMNPLDLSPNYAGSIMSAGCGIGSSVAILAPYLVGTLVPNSTIAEWRFVFWMAFGFAGFSNAIYLWWFKAQVQPWNEADYLENKSKSVGEH